MRMDDPASGDVLVSPLFPGLTGRGVRIAVIDSGVHPDHPHIRTDRLGERVAVARDGEILEGADELGLDRLGHGTAVTAAIQYLAPEAHCLTVRVFHEALRTSAAALVAAIDWSIGRGVDCINLSLGTTNMAHRGLFADAAARARRAGVLLVAAQEAGGEPCLPGALPDVLGIGLDWDCPTDRYRLAGSAETGGSGDGADMPAAQGAPPEGKAPAGGAAGFFAAGYPRAIPGVPQRRNLYGISFAVARMSGFAALAAEEAALAGVAADAARPLWIDRRLREAARRSAG